MTSAGHGVDLVRDRDSALATDATVQYDLALLEWARESSVALSTCRDLRHRGRRYCILVAGASAVVNDCIAFLDAGADDYVAPDCPTVEIRARIRALLRRVPEPDCPVFEFGDLMIDARRKLVLRGRHPAPLTATQYRILECLAQRAGAFVGRRELCAQVWDANHDADRHALEVHISMIRKHIGDTGRPRLIESSRGQGYRLRETA